MEKRTKAFILDLDGVVYRGSEAVPNASKRIAALREKGRVLFLTNNSTRTRAEYVEKLLGFGIPAQVEDVVTSAYIAATYIREKSPEAKVYVIGEEGLKRELEALGVKTGEEGCTVVLVGLDREFDYRKLTLAAELIRRGAEFVATNTDATLITEKGLLPGAGAMVAAVRAATGKEPVVVGKPSDIAADAVLKILGVEPREVLLIGDRLETDIAMGKKWGMRTALVLTGATSQEELNRSTLKPDFVLESL